MPKDFLALTPLFNINKSVDRILVVELTSMNFIELKIDTANRDYNGLEQWQSGYITTVQGIEKNMKPVGNVLKRGSGKFGRYILDALSSYPYPFFQNTKHEYCVVKIAELLKVRVDDKKCSVDIRIYGGNRIYSFEVIDMKWNKYWISVKKNEYDSKLCLYHDYINTYSRKAYAILNRNKEIKCAGLIVY